MSSKRIHNRDSPALQDLVDNQSSDEEEKEYAEIEDDDSDGGEELVLESGEVEIPIIASNVAHPYFPMIVGKSLYHVS